MNTAEWTAPAGEAFPPPDYDPNCMTCVTQGLVMDRDLWQIAATSLWEFIRENITIVGWDEQQAFAPCKEAYERAGGHVPEPHHQI